MEGLSSQNGIYEMTAGICRIEKVALRMADCRTHDVQGVHGFIFLFSVIQSFDPLFPFKGMKDLRK